MTNEPTNPEIQAEDASNQVEQPAPQTKNDTEAITDMNQPPVVEENIVVHLQQEPTIETPAAIDRKVSPPKQEQAIPQDFPRQTTILEVVETVEDSTPLETNVPTKEGAEQRIVPETIISRKTDAAMEDMPVPSDTTVLEPTTTNRSVESVIPSETSEPGESTEVKKSRPKKPKMPDEVAQPIWDELKAIYENGAPCAMKCSRAVQGGVVVDFKGLEGFLPRSQFALKGRATQSDIDEVVGQDLPLVVIDLSDFEKRKFIVSRKKAVRWEQFSNIKKDAVFDGIVSSITSYGCFVDIGGLDGLVHISRLSKFRVNAVTDIVQVKDKVKVRVVEVDPGKERISLSMKEFVESPWTSALENYPVGSTQKGKIRNHTDYGAYVQLEAGLVGMIHVSELSWTKRVNHPSEVVKIGQEVEVKILNVNEKDKRISLSLKDTLPNPWPRLANIYPVDSEATGTVKHVMNAGAIVTLDFDVDCFVPRGRMGGRRKGQTADSTLQVGDSVQVKIVEMDTEKKSFIASLVREEVETRRSDRRDDNHHQTVENKHMTLDTAVTLGELAGLKNIFQSEPTPSGNEASTSGTAPGMSESLPASASGENSDQTHTDLSAAEATIPETHTVEKESAKTGETVEVLAAQIGEEIVEHAPIMPPTPEPVFPPSTESIEVSSVDTTNATTTEAEDATKAVIEEKALADSDPIPVEVSAESVVSDESRNETDSTDSK